GYSRHSHAHIRRRSCPGPPLTVSSDSSKPLASTSTGGGADPERSPFVRLVLRILPPLARPHTAAKVPGSPARCLLRLLQAPRLLLDRRQCRPRRGARPAPPPGTRS